MKMVGAAPRGVSHTGALQAFRVASSPYGGDMIGGGDVVNMDIDN